MGNKGEEEADESGHQYVMMPSVEEEEVYLREPEKAEMQLTCARGPTFPYAHKGNQLRLKEQRPKWLKSVLRAT